jgi:hypothetical protein
MRQSFVIIQVLTYELIIQVLTRLTRLNMNCVGVPRPGVPKPTSECRRVPQPGWVDARPSAKGGSEVAGDGRERGGNPAAFVFVPRPGRVRLQYNGGYSRVLRV